MEPSTRIVTWERKPLWLISIFGLAALVLTACGGDDEPSAGGVGNPTSAAAARNFPIVTGYYDGEPVDYILAEISDADVTKLMTEKTGFPLVFLPSLADTPDSLLANLYLFMNGVSGPNPFGFQPNVIDSIPGDPGYSPLWIHTFVEWNDGGTPRELKSQEEILAAEEAGEVTLEKSDLVINCPVIPEA